MLLPSSAFETFADEYGELGDEMIRRSLAWALLYALMFVDEVAEQRHLGRIIVARVLTAAGLVAD